MDASVMLERRRDADDRGTGAEPLRDQFSDVGISGMAGKQEWLRMRAQRRTSVQIRECSRPVRPVQSGQGAAGPDGRMEPGLCSAILLVDIM